MGNGKAETGNRKIKQKAPPKIRRGQAERLKQRIRVFIRKMEYLHFGRIGARRALVIRYKIKRFFIRFKCYFVGHKWEYSTFGEIRVCERCRKVERWTDIIRRVRKLNELKANPKQEG